MNLARMRALGCALMTLIAIWALPVAAQGPDGGPHLAMRLVAESDSPRSGGPVTLAIDTRPATGWHGYWANPGDAGFPASFEWTLPRGARIAGEVQWPVPTTLLIAGLMNYVYEAPYAPLVTLDVPPGLAPGTKLPIRLKTDYLVCTDSLCVPESQTLSLDLTIGDGTPDHRADFDRWRAAIPKPLATPATYAAKDGALRIAVPLPAAAKVSDVYFFPLTGDGAVDYAAPQKVTRDGDRLIIATRGKPGGALAGVLRIGPDRGLSLQAQPGTIAAADASDRADAAGDGGAPWAILVAFAGAVLGGLILNIMPCVFPILSLKALSLARGGGDERAARAEALA